MILDGGSCSIGVESTVISFIDKEPVLLRPGGAPLEEIQSLIGPVLSPPQKGAVPLAPGQLENHYAPRTPLFFGIPPANLPNGKKVGLLCLEGPSDPSLYAAIEVLSDHGDLRQAAANLFAAIRRLDEKDLDVILALPVPNQGLGRAINDRLSKACQKK